MTDAEGYLTPEGWRAMGFVRVDDDKQPVPDDSLGDWWFNKELKLQLGSRYSPLGVLRFAHSTAYFSGQKAKEEALRRALGFEG